MPNGSDKELLTFIGFWPAPEMNGRVEDATLTPEGTLSEATRQELRATAHEYAGDGWRMRIANDYLCLLHLPELEPMLQKRREQARDPDSITHGYFGTGKRAWQVYLQALNAWYFTLHAAAFTARNITFMHDFAELRGEWDCERVRYNTAGDSIRHTSYGRPSGTWLNRFGERIQMTAPSFHTIDERLFADAAVYFDTLYRTNNLDLGLLGTKLLTEHRVGNYRSVVALAWFEIEAWVNDQLRLVGYPTTFTTKKGKKLDRRIVDKIDDFLPGTGVGTIKAELHQLREIRNDVAHQNRQASAQESTLAIEMYQHVLRSRTGLAVELSFHPPPTSGI